MQVMRNRDRSGWFRNNGDDDDYSSAGSEPSFHLSDYISAGTEIGDREHRDDVIKQLTGRIWSSASISPFASRVRWTACSQSAGRRRNNPLSAAEITRIQACIKESCAALEEAEHGWEAGMLWSAESITVHIAIPAEEPIERARQQLASLTQWVMTGCFMDPLYPAESYESGWEVGDHQFREADMKVLICEMRAWFSYSGTAARA
jgi:hypothetical protein